MERTLHEVSQRNLYVWITSRDIVVGSSLQLGEKNMEDIPILKLRIETDEYIYEEYEEA